MEDEEHEDLLIRVSSDNEEFTDTEEAFGTSRRNYLQHEKTFHSCFEKFKFITNGVILIISSTALLILLPLYLETANVHSDVFTLLFILTLITWITFLFLGCVIGKLFCKLKVMIGIPFSLSKVVQCGLIYGLSGFLMLYALDRKRVMCHLQDPIKGIVLVFSLVYYFFFCKKILGLQQIFCATTIVVGLFVSVDYGLCDEFRCRGNEREHRIEDAGPWSWQVHSLWTLVYIGSLALWTFHSTLLEGFLVMQKAAEEEGDFSSLPHSQTDRNSSSLDQHRPITYAKPFVITGTQPSSVSIVLWIHLISFTLLSVLWWTDMFPSLGKGSSASEFWSYFTSGFMCHFGYEPQQHQNVTDTLNPKNYGICQLMILYAWPFIASYIVFVFSFVQFLIISESSVFTVAMTTAALPLGSIWWSIFKMPPLQYGNVKGLVQWSPSVTGELICSVLGLPVVLVGLAILYKSHFQDKALGRICSRNQPPGPP